MRRETIIFNVRNTSAFFGGTKETTTNFYQDSRCSGQVTIGAPLTLSFNNIMGDKNVSVHLMITI
jgi:hypothetical protein